MKPYADNDYYNLDFFGEKKISDPKELNEKLILASQKIDEITFNRIIGRGFENLTKFQQQKIKDAVCYQANYILENGIESTDITSYNILDINISIDKKENKAAKLNVSEIAYNYIKQTGLSNGIL